MGPEMMMLLADGGLLLAGGSSSGDFPIPVLAAGPVAGVLVYMAIYARYRNKDKRYKFESESDVQVGNMMMRDRKVDHRRGVTSRRIDGANDHQHLERVRRMPLQVEAPPRKPDTPHPPGA